MNIACIQLTCNRNDLLLKCIQQNYYNSGKDADVFLIDNGSDTIDDILAAYPYFKKVYRFKKNKGIAAAINKGLSLTLSYDAVVLLSNDILMPQNWLKMLNYYAEQFPETGLAGIHCVEHLPPLNSKGVHEDFCPFGNILITRQVIDKIGGFNTAFGLYGMEDKDYALRLHYSGLNTMSYYLPGMHSEHIGHDVGEDSAYRKAKDAGLAKAEGILNARLEAYKSGDVYLPLKF